MTSMLVQIINSSSTGQNGHHFPDDIFKCIFMNERFCILIQISLFLETCHILPDIYQKCQDSEFSLLVTLNLSPPGQNGRHFADDIFHRIFFNENARISIKISLKFVHKGPIHNIPALVQIMAWRRPGDKPLSEPMLNQFTNACVALEGDELRR